MNAIQSAQVKTRAIFYVTIFLNERTQKKPLKEWVVLTFSNRASV